MCVARFRYVSGELAQPLPASLQQGIQARHSAIGWSRARRPGCSIFAASVYAPSGGRPALGLLIPTCALVCLRFLNLIDLHHSPSTATSCLLHPWEEYE